MLSSLKQKVKRKVFEHRKEKIVQEHKLGYDWNLSHKQVMFDEVMEYLRINEFNDGFETLEQMEKICLRTRWDIYRNHKEDYYSHWNEFYLATNTLHQFKRHWITEALLNHCNDGAVVLDHGCCSAALSLAFQRFERDISLILVDIENIPRKFTRYYARKHPEFDIIIEDVDLKGTEDRSVDLILCIDVLEHLKNPSAAFRCLESKLKIGGILILQTPFYKKGGVQPEDHIQEATIDWENDGGRNLLERNYERLQHIRIFDFSIWRKDDEA